MDIINRYYELQLCYAELKAFGANKIEHDLLNNSFIFDGGDIEKLLFRSSWLSEIDGEKTFIQEVIQACRKIIWKYSDLWFSHIAYPFKARMRPQVARSLINITCPKEEGCILDPFCGSGTTNTEAYLCGLDSVGVDIIPFYVYMSEAKIQFFKKEIIFNPVANENNNHPLLNVIHSACTLLKTKFKYEKRASEIIELQRIYFEKIREKIQFAERTRHEFVVGTATDIPYPSEYFDGIVCSPPYGSAIDYTKENPGPKELMEIPEELKPSLILTKDEQSWKKLMKEAFSEMHRVLKKGGRLAIIIGNQKKKEKIIDYVGWSKKKLMDTGFRMLYQFTELISSTGTRNILNDEILIFEKK
ncbi:MAG: TRM11 family SAM-dependent methyltransferase [Candidatus Methanospirareceae archaeon]